MAYKRLPNDERPTEENEVDPAPQPFDPVTFVGASVEQAKPASVAAIRMIQEAQAQEAGKPVKVKIRAPFRVVHEAKPYVGGDVVTVPPGTADAWIFENWAEPVTAKTTKEK